MGSVSRAISDSIEIELGHFPIEDEPLITTMDKPLVIESACPGWQEGGSRFPAVPCSLDDQIRELTDSFNAGAVAVHVHPRDPRTCRAVHSAGLLREIYDGLFANVRDCVTIQHTWTHNPKTMEIDYISETEDLLGWGGGNKYCQGSVVLPVNTIGFNGQLFTRAATNRGIRWLEEHHVKPVFQLYDSFAHFDVKQFAIDKGVARSRPYLLNLNLGKHSSHSVHRDPWSYLNLITNYQMVRETIPESVVGVYPGGRNWMPILIVGLLMGAPLVRVGIEDCYWVWPHKNEVIKKNSDMVKITVEYAQMLGRRVVRDAKEAREYMGLELTSQLG